MDRRGGGPHHEVHRHVGRPQADQRQPAEQAQQDVLPQQVGRVQSGTAAAEEGLAVAVAAAVAVVGCLNMCRVDVGVADVAVGDGGGGRGCRGREGGGQGGMACRTWNRLDLVVLRFGIFCPALTLIPRIPIICL